MALRQARKPGCTGILMLALIRTGLPASDDGGGLPAPALKIDGQLAVEKILGQSMQIFIQGKPGRSPVLFADPFEGPTFAFGQHLPLGFSPYMVTIPLPPLGPSGEMVLNLTLPNTPAFEDLHIHLLAGLVDPFAKNAIDFSNGASFWTIPQPVAGADQSAMVGQAVVLDGSRTMTSDGIIGTAKPGYSVAWSWLQRPGSSNAKIKNPYVPYATFVPDSPGEYVARLTVGAGGTTYVSETSIHAYRILTAPYQDGQVIPVDSFSLSGSVDGPAIQSVTLNGQSVGAVESLAGVSWDSYPMTITENEVSKELHFRITHADGTTANHHITMFRGTAKDIDGTELNAFSVRVDDSAIHEVAALAEAEVEKIDLKQVLVDDLGPQEVTDTTLFSATFQFTNVVYNHDLHIGLDGTAAGLEVTCVVDDLTAWFHVGGKVAGIPYNLSGNVHKGPATLHGYLVGFAQGGHLALDLQDLGVTKSNFNFDLNGFLGTIAQLNLVQDAIRKAIENAMKTEIDEALAPAVSGVLNTFLLKGNLQTFLGVDVEIEAPITGVVHDDHGIGIRLGGIATVGSAHPGAPAITKFRGSTSAAPDFGSLTPGGLQYEAAISISDDIVNQVLAAAVLAGAVEGDLSVLIPGVQLPIPLDTDQLDQIFPESGFNRFPSGTPVSVYVHATVPPVLHVTPTASGDAKAVVNNLQITFSVNTAYGPIPMVTISVSGSAQAGFEISETGEVEVDVGSLFLGASVLRTYPGSSPELIDNTVAVLDGLLALVSEQTEGRFVLPSLDAFGVGITPVEAAPIGGGQHHLGLFGDLAIDISGLFD